MNRALSWTLGLLLFALCGLCLAQWTREAGLRVSLTEVDARLKTEQEGRKTLEDKLAAWEKEIHQLNARLDEQGKKIADQELQAVASQTELTSEKKRADDLAQELASTKTALARAKGILDDKREKIEDHNQVVTQQNSTIEKQNDLLKKLSRERDDLVEKLNNRTREFNELVEKQNAASRRGT